MEGTGNWHSPSMFGLSPLRMTQGTFEILLRTMSLPIPYTRVLQEANSIFLEVHNNPNECCEDMKSMLVAFLAYEAEWI